MSKSTLLRQLTMLKMIPKSPSFVLTKTLHQMLLDEGFAVTKRTVERDLEGLSALMGLTFGESPEGYKWSYAKTNTELLPNMAAGEALMLAVAEDLLRFSLPVEALTILEPRLKKARETLDNLDHMLSWRKKVRVLPSELPLIPSYAESAVRNTVYDCVLHDEQIQLIYQKHADATADYTLNALGLVVRHYNQYLVASKTESADKPQLFLLDKIVDATRLYSPIQRPTDFDITEYHNDNPSGFQLSTGPIDCVLQVRSAAYRVLRNNKIAQNQVLTHVQDDWYECKASVVMTNDLIGWILRYGDCVRVVSPSQLKNEVIARLQSSIRHYQDQD